MSDSSNNFRRDIIDALIPYAEKNGRIILLVGDMGFGVCDGFSRRFPDRIFNVGIMEQGSVGIAAGMAMAGMLPIFYSMVNFLTFRALEQVRNDIVHQKINVKLIGTGANNYFNFLGKSHCCGEDDRKIMELIGMKVHDPYHPEALPFSDLIDKWITDERPGYLRV